MPRNRLGGDEGPRAGVGDAAIGILVMGVSIAALLSNIDAAGSTSADSFKPTLALLTGLAGAATAVRALLSGGPALSRADGRAVAFLGAATALFCTTIETLGLAVAVLTSAITASFAAQEANPREVVGFSVLVTALAIFICSFVLDLDLPLAPFL